jgi:hypothetical protein
MLGGVLLPGISARAADAPPLSQQLTDLGNQAMAQGANALARQFYQKAVQLDPADLTAARGLEKINKLSESMQRVAFQEPAPDPEARETATPPAPAPDPANPVPLGPKATLEQIQAAENLAREQLGKEVNDRLSIAEQLLRTGQPEAARQTLRLLQNVIRSAANVTESVRGDLDRRVQDQMLATDRAEERILSEHLESERLSAAGLQRERALEVLEQNKETIKSMMVQFDSLMVEGIYNLLYNGGTGNISEANAPFYKARLLAQQARALMRTGQLTYGEGNQAPYAGVQMAMYVGYLSQALQFKALRENRFMLTMQDAERASVPFPDDQIMEYPAADRWRELSERRIKRWGKAVDLFESDSKTQKINEKLDDPVAMDFQNETPIEDVLKYIQSATADANYSGIPIYVDPVGLQEAEKTLQSPVTIKLDGVPLKMTLRLILKQLGLTYTVKDGFMKITNEDAEDQQTEIRVYPVADLSIIPFSLMGMGGGMRGGMGGGMGGMGGGMGGGMMGGMGGGMGGGMMGGMGGGMMSVPVSAPDAQDASPSTFSQKKSR